jgi:hypothetical protein
MGKEIDNFGIVRTDVLQFGVEGEFYMILVLRRRKDVKGKVVEGVNEDNRLIKHFFVYDKEYLYRKKDAIIALCKQNNARAYILPQRRSHDIIMWALHNKTGEVLKSGAKNTHFDHLIRSCVAGIHEVPPNAKWHKRWVIDIDSDDDETMYIASGWGRVESGDGVIEKLSTYLADKIRKALVLAYRNRSEEAKEFMPEISGNYKEEDITLLPTPHGFHIVTPPFNREEKAMKKYFGFAIPSSWIKPDTMALLYAPETIGE